VWRRFGFQNEYGLVRVESGTSNDPSFPLALRDVLSRTHV